MRQLFYYKMRQSRYKRRQLLQNSKILLQNSKFYYIYLDNILELSQSAVTLPELFSVKA